MHIILTHEQSDFDALASLLGASLLCENALPVLPRRINRNVRAFLTLYGVELPFIDPRDLPNEAVEYVTLVDTQSMVSIKGMDADTQVSVIDHHARREGLPENWSVTLVEIGATTTLLVEALRESNGGLTTVQATLLLLGIYEDTGSLTYTRTTARDIRAAAHLVEHGASLQVASNFLNHPLSSVQQALYDQLRANARHSNIHGYLVVTACGDAGDMDEELSSIAHKLRDLLDPDALFLLVTTRGGVQFIARSTSDHIDVSRVAAHFGGGGHARAAASLIKRRTLNGVRQELEEILPDFVQPAITVAEIMSSGPQLLSPNTPVDEAARRMRRYGYEGYPVVDSGKVVGLLTRRAVDRALAHKIPLTAASLMEAGQHFVYPSNSVEHLQRLVTDTGWGQIPVVDRESGQIVGIVTRTDLLKTLTSQHDLPSRLNLSDRLEATLPTARLKLLKAIAEAALEQRSALYIVGGFVRDLLLDRPSLDFDLVVEGDAIALAHTLASVYGGRVTSHARFGTAKWHLDGGGRDLNREFFQTGLHSVDLVAARTEFYNYPTALPTVERGSIKLDLHRRDFTMNTLALRLDGRHYGALHDYWGGLQDLRNGLVRVLHSLSFVDDPTRILRAVRFEQRFSFKIGERTMQLLLEARPMIDRLSGDRIRHELNHILALPGVSRILARAHALDLLSEIHPDLGWDDWLAQRVVEVIEGSPADEWGLDMVDNKLSLQQLMIYILWLVRLPPERAVNVAGRLKLPHFLQRVILSACDLWRKQEELSGAAPSRVVEMLEDAPLLARYALYLFSGEQQVRSAVRNYTVSWRKIAPVTDGHVLKAMGLPPGPVYRQILDKLRAAWLDGQISTSQEEKVLLDQIIEQL